MFSVSDQGNSKSQLEAFAITLSKIEIDEQTGDEELVALNWIFEILLLYNF
jgi:hypothetical protein